MCKVQKIVIDSNNINKISTVNYHPMLGYWSFFSIILYNKIINRYTITYSLQLYKIRWKIYLQTNDATESQSINSNFWSIRCELKFNYVTEGVSIRI